MWTDGALRYIFFLEKSKLENISVDSLFPIPKITKEEVKEIKENPALLKPIYQKYQTARKARAEQKVSMITQPTISTYILGTNTHLTLPEKLQGLCFV